MKPRLGKNHRKTQTSVNVFETSGVEDILWLAENNHRLCKMGVIPQQEIWNILLALKFSTSTDSPYLPGRTVVPPSVEFELYQAAPGCLPPQCYWLCSSQRESPPGRGFPNASPASQRTTNRKSKQKINEKDYITVLYCTISIIFDISVHRQMSLKAEDRK